MSSQTVIFGAGFVGQRLAEHLGKCIVTHRQLQTAESVHDQLEFRLQDISTWSNLPDLTAQKVVITLPLDVVPLETLQEFHTKHLSMAKSLIILSTGGFFLPSEPNGVVDETSAKSDKGVMGQDVSGRVTAEEWMLARDATVLALSAIIGDTRRVDTWLKRGYFRSGSKLLNVVYVKDIIQVILHFLSNPSPAERYIVNGCFFLVNDLCKHFGFPPLPEQAPDLTNKKMSSNKLLSVLPQGFKFSSVFEEPMVDRESLRPVWDCYKSHHFRNWNGSVLLFGGDDFAKANIEEEFKDNGSDFLYSWKFSKTTGDEEALKGILDPKGVLSFDKNASPFGIIYQSSRLFCFKDGDFVKASPYFFCRGTFAVSFGFLIDACTRAIISCTFKPDGSFKNYALFREEATEESKFWTEDDAIVPERKAPEAVTPHTLLSIGDGCHEVTQQNTTPFPGYAHLDGTKEVHTLCLPQNLTLVIPKQLTPKSDLQLAAWCVRPDKCLVQLRVNYQKTTYDSLINNVEKAIYKLE